MPETVTTSASILPFKEPELSTDRLLHLISPVTEPNKTRLPSAEILPLIFISLEITDFPVSASFDLPNIMEIPFPINLSYFIIYIYNHIKYYILLLNQLKNYSK